MQTKVSVSIENQLNSDVTIYLVSKTKKDGYQFQKKGIVEKNKFTNIELTKEDNHKQIVIVGSLNIRSIGFKKNVVSVPLKEIVVNLNNDDFIKNPLIIINRDCVTAAKQCTSFLRTIQVQPVSKFFSVLGTKMAPKEKKEAINNFFREYKSGRYSKIDSGLYYISSTFMDKTILCWQGKYSVYKNSSDKSKKVKLIKLGSLEINNKSLELKLKTDLAIQVDSSPDSHNLLIDNDNDNDNLDIELKSMWADPSVAGFSDASGFTKSLVGTIGGTKVIAISPDKDKKEVENSWLENASKSNLFKTVKSAIIFTLVGLIINKLTGGKGKKEQEKAEEKNENERRSDANEKGEANNAENIENNNKEINNANHKEANELREEIIENQDMQTEMGVDGDSLEKSDELIDKLDKLKEKYEITEQDIDNIKQSHKDAIEENIENIKNSGEATAEQILELETQRDNLQEIAEEQENIEEESEQDTSEAEDEDLEDEEVEMEV